MADIYTLAIESIDAEHPSNARWVIRRRPRLNGIGDPDMSNPGEYVASLTRRGGDNVRRILRWAVGELHTLCVRTIEWRPVDALAGIPDRVWYAHTGPWRNSWAVVAYGDRTGVTWRRTGDGRWADPRGNAHDTVDHLDARRGPLIPEEVINLPGLLAELAIYRRVAGYQTGDTECFEHECDAYGEDGELLDPDAETCPHVEHQVAKSDDTFKLARIEAELQSLRARANGPTDRPDQAYTAAELAECATIAEIPEDIDTAATREDDGW